MRTHPASLPSAGTTAGRLIGPDVVRAVALIGVVVMNFHGYLLLRRDTRGGSTIEDFFDPWRGPLATRFAATFVLVAGVGVTLLTRRAIGDRRAVAAKRWTLVRRGLVLYAGGLLLDEIWPGTILPFYGAMFVIAAALFTLRGRWVIAIGAAAAIAGAALAWWRVERRLDGHDTSWLFAPDRSPRGLLFDVAVNGTHPLLPWLSFLCVGIVLGRVMATAWWRPAAIAGGLTLFGIAALLGTADVSGERAELVSTHPYSRGLLYTASALGTALAALGAITWLAQRFAGTRVVTWLAAAGTMTLTIYVTHALAFNLLVDWLGWVRPTGLDTALLLSAAFWVIAVAIAVWWARRHGRGPVERLYRALGG